jgi:hypothetical protein
VRFRIDELALSGARLRAILGSIREPEGRDGYE